MGAIITLLTDFGTRDAYVASMKGVILGLNPEATLVDLTHEIPPQEIRAGALVLAGAGPYFPPGTIHLAVVDPGVGSSRRALAARARGQFWVAPDNGLLHLILSRAEGVAIVSLENPAYFLPRVSATFHGRDIFAPVAAHLSLGVELNRFGPAVFDPVPLELPLPAFSPAAIHGEIIYVDHFGNLVSNVPGADLLAWRAAGAMRIRIGTIRIDRLSHTYTDAPPGGVLALVGSHGYLEIACALDSAAQRLGAGVGTGLEIRPG